VFGAAPERPPDLHVYTAKFRVTNTAKAAASHTVMSIAGGNAVSVDSDEDASEHAEEEEIDEPETMTKNMRNKKRKALALSRVSMDGDDGLDSVHLPVELPIQLKRQNTNPTGASGALGAAAGAAGKKDKYGILVDAAVKMKKHGAAKTGIKDQDEMEKLRAKVQEAYKLMKEKRRLEG